MMQFFNAADGAQLAYRLDGPETGKPVLCLAGLTRNMDDFSYLLPHFPDIRWIRMDYRGRGASDYTGADTYTVPIESQDAFALLDHLGLEHAAVVGTSRGGLNAMMMAVQAKHRLTGVFLNDIGPEIERDGLDLIAGFIGRTPKFPDMESYAQAKGEHFPGFANVPIERWRDEVRHQVTAVEGGLKNRYDNDLRKSFEAVEAAPPVDLWPFFEALAGLPVAVLRGANSNLLTTATVTEMQRRLPGLLTADVPDRGHVPFLDEPSSLALMKEWLCLLP